MIFTDVLTQKTQIVGPEIRRLIIHAFENKTLNAADKLSIFTFTKLEEIYLENKEASDIVSYAFDKYVNEL